MLQEGSGRFQEGAPEGVLHKFPLKHTKTQNNNKETKSKGKKEEEKNGTEQKIT